MKIALAQINPTVGDIEGNLARHKEAIARARELGAQVVVFPELSVTGYPPKDLLLKPSVVSLSCQAVQSIAEAAEGITALVGYPEKNLSSVGRPLYNAVAIVRDGKIVAKRYKSLLPTYDVFDESRYFEPGPETELTFIDDKVVGLSICEDLWNDEQLLPRTLYHLNPIGKLADAGARIIINVSASPFVVGKNAFRRELFGHQAKRYGLPLVYVNQVGANDELVFDGNSAVFAADGRVVACAKDFVEDLLVVDLDTMEACDGAERAAPAEGIASVHDALVMGIRDYARKCGFKSAVLGLSGGIDSAVVAVLAATALGKENIRGVALPSRYSSGHSKSDAQVLAERLGITFNTLPIETIHAAFEQTLEPLFKDTPPGLAEENIQARIRGNLLMALSNKFGHLLLTTGNKSEIATGYCTLYGDMSGGLAPISDVPKLMVYELARHMNERAMAAGAKDGPVPESTITKPPSAELRPDQKDEDSLPPYAVLDAILQRYVEEEKSTWEIIDEGYDKDTVLRVARLVDLSEYKRKQAAPGLKVTSRAFGFGRRMPIAQRYDQKLMSLRPMNGEGRK